MRKYSSRPNVSKYPWAFFIALWLWPSVSFLSATLLTIGMALMTIRRYLLAEIIYVISVALLAAKGISWEYARPGPRVTKATVVFMICGFGMAWIVFLFFLVNATRRNEVPTWQQLADKQRTSFVAELSGLSEPNKKIVKMCCPQTDEQTCIYAFQFVDLFREAGWRVERNVVSRCVPLTPRLGVIILQYASNIPEELPFGMGVWVPYTPAAITIRNAFKTIGVEPESVPDKDQTEQTIGIYFGPPKRDPNEPTNLTRTMEQIEEAVSQGLIDGDTWQPKAGLQAIVWVNHPLSAGRVWPERRFPEAGPAM